MAYWGVISNTARGDCEQVLDSVGLTSYFTQILDSFLVGVEKPDPRIFELAAAKLGVTLHQTAFVGDIYEVDVIGARRAGMQPILLDPRRRRQEPDCTVIASLSELLTLLPKKA
jgi:putative hydrolase of the HAD superfamily